MELSEIILDLFEIFVFIFFAVMELVTQKSFKSLFNFQNKYLLCFWLSIAFFLLHFLVRGASSNPSILLRAITVFIAMASEFLLAVYLLFRGTFLLFSISKEGLEHPTIITLRKLTDHWIIALLFLTFVIIIGYIAHIHSLYYQWISAR